MLIKYSAGIPDFGLKLNRGGTPFCLHHILTFPRRRLAAADGSKDEQYKNHWAESAVISSHALGLDLSAAFVVQTHVKAAAGFVREVALAQ